MVSFPWLWSSREVTIKHAASITSSCGCLLIRRNRSNDCRLWQGSFLLLVSYLHNNKLLWCLLCKVCFSTSFFAWFKLYCMKELFPLLLQKLWTLKSSRNYQHSDNSLNLQSPSSSSTVFVSLKLQVTTLRSWSNVCFLVSITNKLSLIKLLLLLTKIIIIIFFFFTSIPYLSFPKFLSVSYTHLLYLSVN